MSTRHAPPRLDAGAEVALRRPGARRSRTARSAACRTRTSRESPRPAAGRGVLPRQRRRGIVGHDAHEHERQHEQPEQHGKNEQDPPNEKPQHVRTSTLCLTERVCMTTPSAGSAGATLPGLTAPSGARPLPEDVLSAWSRSGGVSWRDRWVTCPPRGQRASPVAVQRAVAGGSSTQYDARTNALLPIVRMNLQYRAALPVPEESSRLAASPPRTVWLRS